MSDLAEYYTKKRTFWGGQFSGPNPISFVPDVVGMTLQMKLLDLFSGGKSVARIAETLGYEVTTLDIDKNTNPTVCANVLDFNYKSHFEPGDFNVVWASPPCDTFTAARRSNIGRMVHNEMMTSERIIFDRETLGVPLLRRTQEIIEYLQPKVWFIENPYTGSMKNYITEKPAVFDYCMFGFEYRKRTAVWSNVPLESVMCDGSHLIDGRHRRSAIGTSTSGIPGQGGGRNKKGRYAIPENLVKSLIVDRN